jgi:hypothetical protein
MQIYKCDHIVICKQVMGKFFLNIVRVQPVSSAWVAALICNLL